MAESPETKLLTVDEVAERLNVSRPTIYRRISEGQLPALRIGEGTGPIRVDETELRSWLYSTPREAA